ncbi:uncharacterized protein BX664DRAFT_327481, partial [Halteromyces radiatus]|uniref:uncharacterized protein n=1 Tax=Halteromyces radiatus TaxID=101107 RepID=UPI00221E40ED
MPSHINDLPYEVMLFIFRLLNRSDHCTLRLVNRVWNRLANPFAFESITFRRDTVDSALSDLTLSLQTATTNSNVDQPIGSYIQYADVEEIAFSASYLEQIIQLCPFIHHFTSCMPSTKPDNEHVDVANAAKFYRKLPNSQVKHLNLWNVSFYDVFSSSILPYLFGLTSLSLSVGYEFDSWIDSDDQYILCEIDFMEMIHDACPQLKSLSLNSCLFTPQRHHRLDLNQLFKRSTTAIKTTIANWASGIRPCSTLKHFTTILTYSAHTTQSKTLYLFLYLVVKYPNLEELVVEGENALVSNEEMSWSRRTHLINSVLLDMDENGNIGDRSYVFTDLKSIHLDCFPLQYLVQAILFGYGSSQQSGHLATANSTRTIDFSECFGHLHSFHFDFSQRPYFFGNYLTELKIHESKVDYNKLLDGFDPDVNQVRSLSFYGDDRYQSTTISIDVILDKCLHLQQLALCEIRLGLSSATTSTINWLSTTSSSSSPSSATHPLQKLTIKDSNITDTALFEYISFHCRRFSVLKLENIKIHGSLGTQQPASPDDNMKEWRHLTNINSKDHQRRRITWINMPYTTFSKCVIELPFSYVSHRFAAHRAGYMILQASGVARITDDINNIPDYSCPFWFCRSEKWGRRGFFYSIHQDTDLLLERLANGDLSNKDGLSYIGKIALRYLNKMGFVVIICKSMKNLNLDNETM